MRILHLSSERTWRGGEQQIAYLIKESIKNNLEIVVACRKDSAFEKWCIKESINYYSLSYSNEIDVFTAMAIKKICKKHKIDIVHGHSSHSHALAVWSQVLGCPSRLIISRRVDFPIKNNTLSRLKFNHKSVEKYICVSKAIEDILRKDLKHPEKCVTVHSGIDLDRFKNNSSTKLLQKELQLPKNAVLIGNISAVADHKDYPTFIATAKLVAGANEKAYFAIIGDGPLFKETKTKIKEEGLEERVFMLGFKEDIPSIIKDLDIFLISSKTEGLGTTVLDAIANKLPVVATKAGGIPEMIKHRETGLIYDIKDAKGLAEGVLELIKSPSLGEKLCTEAYQLLIRDFLKEATAKKTFKIYEELLSNNEK